MIKLLSVKTRLPGSTRAAFRRHYEERHVPLGLRFVDRFRWRRYVRNHVVCVESGQVGFDCLTEFWIAGRGDQEATRAFVASPEFGPLDEDDARFLDVGRRFSCELAEQPVAGSRPVFDEPGTRRRMLVFDRPDEADASAFAKGIERELARLRAQPALVGARLGLDLRADDGPSPGAFAALVSVWSPPGAMPPPIDWRGVSSPVAEILCDVVETPAALLGPVG